MCDDLMHREELFEKYFLDYFVNLGSDKVENVRIIASRSLATHLRSNGTSFLCVSRIKCKASSGNRTTE